MVRIRAHSMQDSDIRFQGGQAAQCWSNWPQLWGPGTRPKAYTWRSLSGFGEPSWALGFTSSAWMNNSVHVTWGSPGLLPAGVCTVAQNEKEGVDVCYAHIIHPETVHPLAEEGKQLKDCLKKKIEKNSNQLEWFPHFLFSGEGVGPRPATLFWFLLNLLLWTSV